MTRQGAAVQTTFQENTAPTAELYRELPFPDDGVVRTSVARILRVGLEKHRPQLLTRGDFRLIDVGCGTGEITAGLAQMFPRAQVVGIDINPPSLQRAQSLAERLGQHTGFCQADVSQDLAGVLRAAGVLDDRGFDVIVSIGVLHHTADPAAAFRQVRQIAAPGALFLCFMYSSYGRREDMAVKGFLNEATSSGTQADRAQLLKLLGIANRDTTGEFVRVLRKRLRFGPPMPLVETIKLYLHRNRAARLADTFSNPSESLYTFGQLEQLCRRAGWQMIDLAKKGGLPTTPEEHTRNADLREALQGLPRDVLYDFFAFYYHARGYFFFAEAPEVSE